MSEAVLPDTSDTQEVEGKVCTACEKKGKPNPWKPLTEFNRDSRRADGRRVQCRDCEQEYRRAYDETNRERKNEMERRRRKIAKGKDEVESKKEQGICIVEDCNTRLNRYHREHTLWDTCMRHDGIQE